MCSLRPCSFTPDKNKTREETPVSFTRVTNLVYPSSFPLFSLQKVFQKKIDPLVLTTVTGKGSHTKPTKE